MNNQLKGKSLGILGGIGPEASAVFYYKLIKEIQKRKLVEKNSDFPRIVMNSIPAKELFSCSKDKIHLKEYLEGIKDLNNNKVNLITIVCNTAYNYLNELKRISNSQIINLIEEVKRRIDKKKRYLILASSSTINSNIYSFKGIDIKLPSKTEMRIIDDLIFNYNLGKKVKKNYRQLIPLIVSSIKEKRTIILGCTELSLIFGRKLSNKLDTFDILIESTLNNLKNTKLINN